jgi:hypothetical protein
VANDEQNPAGLGVPPDAGYRGHDGIALEKNKKTEDAASGDVKSRGYTRHDIRKNTLWGNLMAGGAGVEYYFGYALPENDLECEDWRSREGAWQDCRRALDFFRNEKIPFWEMQEAGALVGNTKRDNTRYCLAKPGQLYLVYFLKAGACEMDLKEAAGVFTAQWFNPRQDGPLLSATPAQVRGGATVALPHPPADASEDWLLILRKP